MDDGVVSGYRVPEFDLEVSAQDENPYKTMEYNQLALQLFQMGFFRADMADQALRCLELMDFKNKDRLMSSILRGQTADPARQAQSVPAGVAEMQKLSAMDRIRQQTQEAVSPDDLRSVRGESGDPAGARGICAPRRGHRVRRRVGAGVSLIGALEEKGLLRELVVRPGFVTVAAEGDCQAEWQLIRCGLGQLAGKYPACVRLEA